MFRRMVVCGYVVAMAIQVAMAGQITVLDQTYVHTGWHRQFSKAEMVTVPTAANKNDDCYFRFEIKEFTGQQNVTAQFQPCMFWNSIGEATHACWVRNGAYSFKEPETRYIKRTMSSMWRYSNINWANVMCFMLIDNAGSKGAAKAKLRAEVIFVSPGEDIQVPDHWVEPENWDACVDQGCKQTSGPVSTRAPVRNANAAAGLFQVAREPGQVIVSAAAGHKPVVTVFDMKGERVAHRAIPDGGSIALRQSELGGAGVYVLRVSDGSVSGAERIIVR